MPLDQSTRERIRKLVDDHPVLLFMKGDRDAPQCGFSATVIQLLDQLVPDYHTCDVLADPALREGIKEFSEWPTIPQLYVRGEFVGGSDIVGELFESAELHALLGVDLPDPSEPPSIQVSEAAADALRAGLEQAGDGGVLRLLVDARHRSRMVISPPGERDLVARHGDLSIHLDPLSASRAADASIDVQPSRRGIALKVLLPHAPAG
jgi:monothiol glutaredoxin